MNNKSLSALHAEAHAEAHAEVQSAIERLIEISNILDRSQAFSKATYVALLKAIEIEVRSRRTSINNARFGSSNALSSVSRAGRANEENREKLREAIESIKTPVLVVDKPVLEVKEEPKLVLDGEQDNLAERKEKRFEEMWGLYPHSRRNLKKQIRTKFVHMSEELQIKIISHIKEMKETEQWQNEQFVPNISTYFNQSRWEVAPLPPTCLPTPRTKVNAIKSLDSQVVERSTFTFNEL